MNSESSPTRLPLSSPPTHDAGHAPAIAASPPPSPPITHTPTSQDVTAKAHVIDTPRESGSDAQDDKLNDDVENLATLMDTTMVDGPSSAVTEKGAGPDSTSSHVSLPREVGGSHTGGKDEGGEHGDASETLGWDPLRPRSRPNSKDVNQTQDLTVVVEEDVGDQLLDADGRVLFADEHVKPSPAGSRRASHLHLDIKPPSPQPWELIEPPGDDGRKGGHDFCSTLGSRKFNAMQSPPPSRPLIPKSSYYFGPPASDSAYGTPPMGQIGFHHPREILRVERDYTGGELIQFAPIYPLELEGRITPTQFLESINSINELLISAHSLRHSFLDNMLTVFTLQLSKLFVTSHYDKELQQLQSLIDDLNVSRFNPAGLNILWPGKVAFLFLEIEYYVSGSTGSISSVIIDNDPSLVILVEGFWVDIRLG